jgi:hypothetical protein
MYYDKITGFVLNEPKEIKKSVITNTDTALVTFSAAKSNEIIKKNNADKTVKAQ